MDELAAMAACPPSELPYLGTSGIILASEGNNTDGGMYSLYSFLLAPSSIACFDPRVLLVKALFALPGYACYF